MQSTPTMRILPHYFTLLLICLCALSTSACKSLQQRERFEINQASIQNDTQGTLHNIRVQHYPTKAVGTTTAILPGKALNVGFDGRTLMADSCMISWFNDSGTVHQQEIILPLNTQHDQSEKHLIYHIARDGKVTAELINSN